MMPCGKHLRPSSIPIERPAPHSLKFHQRYRRKLQRDEARGSCICDYWDYQKLYGERKAVRAGYKVFYNNSPT